ncbi:MAG: hypothetical protein KA712_05945 [Myxococcales bacterium]|nr:hypothetical protein [Myxococcales bacterium]
MEVALQDKRRFYRAGALGLRALQDRQLGPDRFSANAEARWKAFRGELTDADRLDLLLRDGAVKQPLAFSAARVFGLPDLASDEPFGPDWVSLQPADAGPLLREARDTPPQAAGAGAFLKFAADLWGLAPGPVVTGAVASAQAASRIIVAGAGAAIALVEHAEGRSDMDLGDQVLLVAQSPGERQILGLGVALLGGRQTPRTVTAQDPLTQARALGFDRATLLLVSQDAAPEVRQGAAALAAALGVQG